MFHTVCFIHDFIYFGKAEGGHQVQRRPVIRRYGSYEAVDLEMLLSPVENRRHRFPGISFSAVRCKDLIADFHGVFQVVLGGVTIRAGMKADKADGFIFPAEDDGAGRPGRIFSIEGELFFIVFQAAGVVQHGGGDVGAEEESSFGEVAGEAGVSYRIAE